MAPLPPIWDPAKATDKLPQPFRMIDKIVSEIIELAIDEIVKKDKHIKHLKTINTNTHFPPHAVLRTEGDATCFATLGVAGLSVAGRSNGGLVAFSARDNTAIGKDDASHTSTVTAMDAGYISATATKVVVSASSGHLAVHDVIIKTAELIPLAKTELPADPDDPDGSPTGVFFSPNSGHIAVCYASGALAVYELLLPPRYYVTGRVETNMYQAPVPVEGIKEEGTLSLLLHLPVAVVKTLLVGCQKIGPVNIVWQLQQRPDKSGRSDRFHKPAKGVYMWWLGCNKLALSRLSSSAVPEAIVVGSSGAPLTGGAAGGLATNVSKPATPATKPATPSQKPTTPGTKPASSIGSKDPKGAAAAAPEGEEGSVVGSQAPMSPDKGWLFPHGISASASTEDGSMLAFGLADGSVLIWDDSSGCHTKILSRMPAAICAMAYVNGTSVRLFTTSTDGTMHCANLQRPEDSYTPSVKLPGAAQTVFFLPNDPFAFIIIKGSMSYKSDPAAGNVVAEAGNVVDQPPKFYWFHMVEQKLVAECVGKDATEPFGSAGLIRQPGVLPEVSKPPLLEAEPSFAPTGKAGKGKDAPPPVAEPAEEEAPAKVALDPAAPPVIFPRWFIRDSYLIVGGPRAKSTSYRPPKGMMEEEVPDEMWPRESVLFLYKLDALSRYLLPEELKSNSAKSMLDRMLADLNPIKKKLGKHVRYDQPDPDAPKPLPGVLKGKEGEAEATEDDDDAKSNVSVRKHIMFDLTDEMFDESADKEKKIFKKETVKGGYSQKKDPNADPGDPNKPEPIAIERPKSPPWHHTNPLARIHPDWEEAPVLTRVMDRLGNKGGGRRRRDFNLRIANEELSERLAMEPGAKPRLLPPRKVKA